MDLIEFLRARLSEEAAEAEAAKANVPWAWIGCDLGNRSDVSADFITTWSPTRILAEVAAKRARLELHQPVPLATTHPDWQPGTDVKQCLTCRPGHFAEVWPCRTIRMDLVVYAEHPDFHPSWRL